LGAGDPAGAVEALSQSLRLAPDQADAKHNLELALRELERRRGGRQPSPPDDSREPPPDERPDERQGERPGPRPDEGQPGGDEPEESQPGPERNEPQGQGEPQAQGEPRPQGAGEGGPEALPRFRELPDMTAEQAAALLEAVENLERQQRRRAAAQGQRRRAETGEDW
jgi:hypothetical protein